MMIKNFIPLFFLLNFIQHFSFSQNPEESSSQTKFRKFAPAVKVGYNYNKLSTAEVGFLFGFASNSTEQTKFHSLILQGPSLCMEIGKYNKNLLLAPKISYEWYTMFFSGRFSFADYTDLSFHKLYATGELGITMMTIVNIWAGVNIPLNGRLQGISDARVSASINLHTLLFKKEKEQKN